MRYWHIISKYLGPCVLHAVACAPGPTQRSPLASVSSAVARVCSYMESSSTARMGPCMTSPAHSIQRWMSTGHLYLQPLSTAACAYCQAMVSSFPGLSATTSFLDPEQSSTLVPLHKSHRLSFLVMFQSNQLMSWQACAMCLHVKALLAH